MAIIRQKDFETNLPVELRFGNIAGEDATNEYGPQMRFSTDKGFLYLNQNVADILLAQIREQRVQAGEPVEVTKREVARAGGRKGIEWQLYKVGFAPGEQPDGTFAFHSGAGSPVPAPAAAATKPQTACTVNNGNGSSNGHGQVNGNGGNAHVTITDGRPKTKLEDALKTVIAAVHSANEYAKTVGYAIPQFTSEDLRTMANTLMIERRGGPNA